MRNAGGDLIAHAAAHDKVIVARPEGEEEEELRVAGIAEVMVHPAARGMGHVKELLGVAHPALERMGFAFAVLFGRPAVYRSSGYLVAENPIRYYDDESEGWKTERFREPERSFMYRPLRRADWPAGIIDIRGPRF
jgi:predicted acetyltransferase